MMTNSYAVELPVDMRGVDLPTGRCDLFFPERESLLRYFHGLFHSERGIQVSSNGEIVLPNNAKVYEMGQTPENMALGTGENKYRFLCSTFDAVIFTDVIEGATQYPHIFPHCVPAPGLVKKPFVSEHGRQVVGEMGPIKLTPVS